MANKEKKKDPLEGYGYESGEAFLKDAKKILKYNLDRMKMDVRIAYSKLKAGTTSPADKIKNYDKKEKKRKSKVKAPNVKTKKTIKSNNKIKTVNTKYKAGK